MLVVLASLSLTLLTNMVERASTALSNCISSLSKRTQHRAFIVLPGETHRKFDAVVTELLEPAAHSKQKKCCSTERTKTQQVTSHFITPLLSLEAKVEFPTSSFHSLIE